MPLPGGASDKVGNRYELLWTVNCMLRVMQDDATSIRLEPPGEEGEGIEFVITTADGREYHQAKRQITGRGVWSLASLDAEGVLRNFYKKLDDQSATCVFVSGHAAHPLDELADRARSADDWESFSRHYIDSNEWRGHFNNLHNRWAATTNEDAFQRLKRVYVREVDETSLREWVENGIEGLVSGNPATVRSVLSDFALNQTQRKLTASDIWAHLKSHGFGKLALREDEEVNEALAELNETYLAGTQPVGIGGEIISRAEVSRILANFDDDQPCNIALVTGKAGVGKSSVIAQTLGAIDGREWPLLVLRVDRLEPSTTPRELGRQLGFPASTVSVLANIANGRECLLVIDQLGAVSLASGRNPEFFDCIGAMISQAQLHPNMRVLAACRKFDVDNDHRIREIVRTQDTATEIPLTEFDEATVREIVAKLGLDAGSLNSKQLELLSLPVHLRLLAALPSVKTGAPLRFQTAKELYDEFWDEKKRVLRERVDTKHVQEVADLMAESMSERQALSIPASLLDDHDHTKVVDIMASENILVKDGVRVSFFHESFFDYIFARRMVENDFDAVHFIFGQRQILLLRLLRIFVPTRKGQNMLLRLLRAVFSVRERQSLFVRSQLRQVLLHQRDVSPQDALRNMAAILEHTDIRPHLKDIALALLGSLDDPTEDEWRIALEPMLDTELSDRAWRALYGSVAWFDVLDSVGVIGQWLNGDNEELFNRTMLLLRLIQEKRADRVAELLSPFLGVSEDWNQRLLDLLVYPKIAASRGFYDFVIKAIKQGIIDDLFVSGNRGFGTWYGVEEALETNPLWACELGSVDNSFQPD